MVRIVMAKEPKGCMVGKLDGNNGNRPRTPFQVGLQEEGTGWARVEPDRDLQESEDGWRPGKVLDVKPGLHWVLTPLEDGSYQLQRVHAWYQFMRTPSLAGRGRASGQKVNQPGVGGGAKKDPEKAQKEAEKQRRLDAARYEALRGNKRSADEDDENEDPTAGAVKKDDDIDYDETGEKRQKRKRRKIIRKAGQAAEEFGVVDTANEMKELKRDEGEDGWENEDEELFSDDEEDNFESFHGMERDENEQEEKVAMKAGDGEDEELEDAQAVDEMNEHGEALKALLEADPETLWEQGQEQATKVKEEAGEDLEMEEEKEEEKIEVPAPAGPPMQKRPGTTRAPQQTRRR